MPVAAIIPYVAAAASLAGAGASIIGNRQAASNMAAQRAAEVQRQSALNRQAQEITKARINNSGTTTAAEQINKGATDRTNAWQALNTIENPVASALPATGTGTATGKATSRATGAGNAWNILNSSAQAREAGYGDWQNRQGLENEGAADKLAVIKNFSGADASLQPAELEAAYHSGDQLGAWGNIVSTLGQVAGLANSAGAFGRVAPAQTPLSQVNNYPGTARMLSGVAANNTARAGLGDTTLWTRLFNN